MKDYMKVITIMILTTGLTACAGAQFKQSMDASSAKLDGLSRYELRNISLSPSGHPRADDAMSYCGGSFVSIRAGILKAIDESLSKNNSASSALLTAKQNMEKAERWLADCANRYGVRMWAVMEGPGASRSMKTSEWLRQNRIEILDYRTAANGYRTHHEKMRGLQTAIGMGLVSGSLSYGQKPSLQHIEPYMRSDGTMVEGHFRATPNDFCFDNLDGC